RRSDGRFQPCAVVAPQMMAQPAKYHCATHCTHYRHRHRLPARLTRVDAAFCRTGNDECHTQTADPCNDFVALPVRVIRCTVAPPNHDGSRMQYWLMKSEPDQFGIADLERVKVEPWTGVRSFFARAHMRAMAVGDAVLFHHSNAKPPGVAGLARVVR